MTQDVWAFASMMQKKFLGEDMEVELYTLDGTPLKSFSGMQAEAAGNVDDMPDTDLVILHAIWGDPEEVLKSQAPLWPKLRNGTSKECLYWPIPQGHFYWPRQVY